MLNEFEWKPLIDNQTWTRYDFFKEQSEINVYQTFEIRTWSELFWLHSKENSTRFKKKLKLQNCVLACDLNGISLVNIDISSTEEVIRGILRRKKVLSEFGARKNLVLVEKRGKEIKKQIRMHFLIKYYK